MISPEEKSILLNNAISTYIFNYCFSQKNEGKVFDAQAWSNAVDEATKDPMFTLSSEAMANFEKVVINLDAYAVEKDSIKTAVDKKAEKKKGDFILV